MKTFDGTIIDSANRRKYVVTLFQTSVYDSKSFASTNIYAYII